VGSLGDGWITQQHNPGDDGEVKMITSRKKQQIPGRRSVVLFMLLFVVGLSSSASAEFVSAVNALEPIAYWRFQEADKSNGAALVSETGNFNGTYHVAAGSSIQTVSGPNLPGLQSTAAQFNGGPGAAAADPNQRSSWDYADFNATGLPIGNASRSWFGWVRVIPTDIVPDYQIAFDYGNQELDQAFVVFSKGGTNPIDSGYALSWWGSSIADLEAQDPDVWQFLAYTHDSATSALRMYVNGSLVDTANKTLNTQNNNFGPGSTPLGTIAYAVKERSTFSGWRGDLAEMAIFDKTLSDQDISNLYQAALVPEPGLLWPALAAAAGGMVFLRRQARAALGNPFGGRS
jgi:hypothetical protein